MSKVRPYIGFVIASVVALAAVVVMLVQVLPARGRTQAARGTVQNIDSKLTSALNAEPPVTEDQIRDWRTAREGLRTRYTQTVDFYKVYDEQLERWFHTAEGLPVRDKGQFITLYRARGFDDPQSSLEARLRAAGVALGHEQFDGRPGFAWEDITSEAGTQLLDNEEIRRLLQKRFWVRERITNSILGGPQGTNNDLGVQRLLEIRFLQELPGMDPQRPPSSGLRRGEISLAEFPTGVLAGMTAGGFGVVKLESEPYIGDREIKLARTLSFGVSIVLPVDKVPEFLSRLADPQREPRMLVVPIAWQFFVFDQNPPEVPITVTPEMHEHLVQAERAKFGPKPVVLVVTMQVLDFLPHEEQKLRQTLQPTTP